MSDVLRDCKKYTSKSILVAIQEHPESRRELLLDKFAFEARKTGRAEFYKLWKDDNHAIDLTHLSAMEKVDYVHLNPVRAGLVAYPEQYLYSSAMDYTGGKGLVEVSRL
jgi:hypothetical protein